MAGNAVLHTLPDTGFEVKGIFKSEQDDTVYEFIYAENTTKGRLYCVIANQVTAVKDSNNNVIEFTLTGKCNGLTMSSSAYDRFIFTNGVEAYVISWEETPSVTPLNFTVSNNTRMYKKDYEGHDIKFIAMAVWNGRLVVATDYGVRGCHDNDIYTWNDNPTTEAMSWYINYTEKVTALYAYTGGLFIFTADNTDFLSGNPNSSSSILQTTAGVGCHSYTSIVKHDTYLFFYDNNQKNIYYIQNIDNGQTRPTGPAAKEIQSAFNNVKTFKMYSCIYENKNEIWIIVTDIFDKQKIYIYNYYQGEWIQRYDSELKYNTYCLINNAVHSGRDNKVYLENSAERFFKSNYKTCFINAGSNTNLKKQKTPLLLVLNDTYTNDFYIRLTVNGKQKNAKHIAISVKNSGVYGSTDEVLEIQPAEQTYGSTENDNPCALYDEYNPYSKKVIEVSTPQTWYTLMVEIYTNTSGQGFYINSMELKNMKAKLKTKGR